MNIRQLVAVSCVSLALTGAVFAVQQGRDPGERTAQTSLTFNQDDEISLSYRTLKYGQATLERMKDSEEMRAQWAKFMPQLLKAELKTDVALKYKTHTLQPGTYSFTFGMNADGGWELYLWAGERRAAKVALEVSECPTPADYLSMNLLSTGADSFRLVLNYGSMTSHVDATVAAEKPAAAEGQRKSDG